MEKFILAALLLSVASAAYHDDTCAAGRTVIVHLFNWKWTDIAAECENFLGPKGFCGVQVSPPNEHRIVTNPWRPWWERYQPVSYKLESRSGTEAQFTDMVARCNAVNVKIFVDAVINHMCGVYSGSGTGSGGSYYDPGQHSYPGVPYSSWDFNCCNCGGCSTSDCIIHNYNDTNQVRNCRLKGDPDILDDLYLGKYYVRQKVAEYLNKLVGLGVAGFRIDALKHMWPHDVEAVLSMVNNLNTAWFPSNTRPFFFNEVIDLGTEVIRGTEYIHLGKVTEFLWSKKLGMAFRRHYTLNNLKTIGPIWGFLPSDRSLIFVDNHDNQRGHGGGGAEVLTIYEAHQYKMAIAFTLAHNYGFPRILSSYYWDGGRWSNDWIGPPANTDGTIKNVPIYADGTCGDGWACEHRWRQITNMVWFRNVVNGEPLVYWWDNGGNQIAFTRGTKGFIAINNEETATMEESITTCLSPGVYCDVISGDKVNNKCTGKHVLVTTAYKAELKILATDSNPFIAIHAESKATGFQRTVVLMYKQTQYGQDAFLRGGIDHSRRSGCTSDASTSACALSIVNRNIGSSSHYNGYNAWRSGNTKLNWYGAQAGQGSYNGQQASGSPLVWTSNNPSNAGHQAVNTYGDHYWLLDVHMNCEETLNGWFEVKTFLTNYATNGGWEPT